MIDLNASLKDSDSELYTLVKAEEERSRNTLRMIASENYASRAVMECCSSCLTDKYAEGYPGERYYPGNRVADNVERLAVDRAKRLFGTDYANVQPHAGSQANTVIYQGFLKPQDVILSMDLAHGGHLTHGSSHSISGKFFTVYHYAVDEATERIDLDKVRDLAVKHKPKLIISGYSSYPRTVPFEDFGNIAREVGACHMADISHIAGLIAGGAHPSSIPYADFTTTTTHKTLRGPRGAMILSRAEYAARLDSALFPGVQGGPFLHIIAAKAEALREALDPEFGVYARNVVSNAKVLAERLMEHGLRLVSNGTDNHLMLVDVVAAGTTGLIAQDTLESCGIIANRNKIPFDKRGAKDPSGIRLGTAALTTRGMGCDEMRTIGDLVASVIYNPGRECVMDNAREKVKGLTERFPVPGLLIDDD